MNKSFIIGIILSAYVAIGCSSTKKVDQPTDKYACRTKATIGLLSTQAISLSDTTVERSHFNDGGLSKLIEFSKENKKKLISLSIKNSNNLLLDSNVNFTIKKIELSKNNPVIEIELTTKQKCNCTGLLTQLLKELKTLRIELIASQHTEKVAEIRNEIIFQKKLLDSIQKNSINSDQIEHHRKNIYQLEEIETFILNRSITKTSDIIIFEEAKMVNLLIPNSR